MRKTPDRAKSCPRRQKNRRRVLNATDAQSRLRELAEPAGRPDCIHFPARIASNPLSLRTGTPKKPGLSRLFQGWQRERSMAATYNILFMGASYGSLLASKLLFGGHN